MGGEIVLAALRAALAALRALGHDPVLVGGLAIQGWGRVRQTKDVDLLILSGEKDRERVFRAAEGAGLVRDPVRPVVSLPGATILRLAYSDARTAITVRVDLIEAGPGFMTEAVRRALPARLFEETLRLASCEDLVLMKLLAGRPIDRADALDLLRVNAAQLDWSYLTKTAGALGIGAELQAARDESGR